MLSVSPPEKSSITRSRSFARFRQISYKSKTFRTIHTITATITNRKEVYFQAGILENAYTFGQVEIVSESKFPDLSTNTGWDSVPPQISGSLRSTPKRKCRFLTETKILVIFKEGELTATPSAE